MRRVMNVRGSVAVFDGGRIVCRTPDLASAGLMPGDALDRARTEFPGVTFFARDQLAEQLVWQERLDAVYSLTPQIESVQPGLAFTGLDRREALGEMVERLAACGGIAATRPLARLAMLRARPGSIAYVTDAQRDEFLAATDVGILESCGFDNNLVAKLQLFGWRSVASLLKLSRRHSRIQFGEAGEQLHDFLQQCFSDRPLPMYLPPRTKEHTHVFEDPVREPYDVVPVLELMTHGLAETLEGMRVGRVRLVARDHRCAVVHNSARVMRTPEARASVLLSALRVLCDNMLHRVAPLTELTIEFSALTTPAYIRNELFSKRQDLHTAVAAVNRRFPGTMKKVQVTAPWSAMPEERTVVEVWE